MDKVPNRKQSTETQTKVCRNCVQLFKRPLKLSPKQWDARIFCSRECNTTNRVHGDAGRIPEYGIWQAMIQRCTNPNSENWPRYGGRGISVCRSWQADFRSFLMDMGKRPNVDFSLDRVENNGNYEPANCRWAPIKVQARNTRTNRFLVINGERRTVAEWSELSGIKANTIVTRLRLGWSEAKAVNEPCKEQCRTKRART
jgi:hypothetical protein